MPLASKLDSKVSTSISVYNWQRAPLLSLRRTRGIQTHGPPCRQLHPHIGEPRSRPTERSSLQETPLPHSGGAGQETERNRQGQNPHSLNVQQIDWIPKTHTRRWGFTVKSNTEKMTSHRDEGACSGRSVSRVAQQEGRLKPWEITVVRRFGQCCQCPSDALAAGVGGAFNPTFRIYLTRTKATVFVLIFSLRV